MERRTLEGEGEDGVLAEVRAILRALQRDDPEFEGSAVLTFSRPAYRFPPGLHGCEQYVRLADVVACRETLVRLAAEWL